MADVKKLDKGGWCVKLGAGILPITITREALEFYNNSNFRTGTVLMFEEQDMNTFHKKMDAIQAINEFEAKSK